VSGQPTPVALISGVTRGIGLAVVEGLAAAGLMVVTGARDPVVREFARRRLGAPAGGVESP
jgi:NAD(P)-dependent dehydrogenase (short-subunit alcohol dehydrogenase family)